MTYHLKVPPNGRIVLPAELREKLGIAQGGPLTIYENEEGAFEIASQKQIVRRIQARYKELVGDRSGFSSDDLIAERRREAALEDAKYP